MDVLFWSLKMKIIMRVFGIWGWDRKVLGG